tara:strand:+ start:116 stop:931 length:816 start_codon:yes stop_codon:yes gene_type:complete
MQNLKMYCICIHDEILPKVKKLNYIPVGLGDDNFNDEWIRDNSGDHISEKNKFYGEYTFHYWLWKNDIKNIDKNDWIGFCAYRRFWLNEKDKQSEDLKFQDKILRKIPKIWDNYQVILGDEIYVDDIKWSKILKYGKISLIKNPKSILKKNRNIKFHFDMFHGNGNLDKAINVLNHNDREDFRNFVNSNNSYNQGNMFICKSRDLILKYYETIFKWLGECEKIFGFDLDDYGKIRIYGFLAERFLPFWFKKYSRYLEWPVIFNDLRKENLN